MCAVLTDIFLHLVFVVVEVRPYQLPGNDAGEHHKQRLPIVECNEIYTYPYVCMNVYMCVCIHAYV